MNKNKYIKGFWEQLHPPLFVVAPMADVTDAPFRKLFSKYGKPDVMWTEFVSADGLFLRPIVSGVGDIPHNRFEEVALSHGIGTNNPLLKDLIFCEEERPIVAQFFSRNPERMKKAAAFARDLGYDGIDINMGCPVDIICSQGAGAAIIKEPNLAKEIIYATQEGAKELPVSVKTRVGYHKNELETWIPNLLETHIPVLSLHARTRSEMSKVPAQWERVKRVVEIRNEKGYETVIIGNGDIRTRSEGLEKIKETGCNGVMIGRGLFGNPWWFSTQTSKEHQTIRAILEVLVEHAQSFEELLGETKSFAVMKKHIKAYVEGFEGAKELRTQLMEKAINAYDIKNIIGEFIKKYDIL